MPEGTPLEIERVQHIAAINARNEFFIGRQDVLDSLISLVYSKATIREKFPSGLALAVVWGKAGCGKSALMARFCKTLQSPKRDGDSAARDDDFILYHIVGATPASQSLRGLLRRLCQELMVAAKTESALPESIEGLCESFGRLLSTFSRRVIIVIDAVNQVC